MADRITTSATRSRAEIEKLKRQWMADGTWDIEDTAGFEAHYDELLAWRLAHEKRRAESEGKRLVHVIRARAAHFDAWLAALSGTLSNPGMTAEEAMARADKVALLLVEQHAEAGNG